jgi:hypothetical protein
VEVVRVLDPLPVLDALSGDPVVQKIAIIYAGASLLRLGAFAALNLFWDLRAHNRKRRRDFDVSS